MLRRFAGWLMGLMACGDPSCATCAPRLMRRRPQPPTRFACNIGSHHPYLRSDETGQMYVGCKFCDHRDDQ